MDHHEAIETILEIELNDYLDNSAAELATAFKDLFGRQLNDIEAKTICNLLNRRLNNMEVVW